jgi:hypothetical protein
VQGAGFRVQGSWCRVQGAGFRVQGAGCRVQGDWGRETWPRPTMLAMLLGTLLDFVEGSGFRVQGSGFRVLCGIWWYKLFMPRVVALPMSGLLTIRKLTVWRVVQIHQLWRGTEPVLTKD